MVEHTEVVDREAREAASRVKNDLENRNVVVDLLFENVNGKLDRLESMFKWVGGLIVMLFIATLSWSLTQQWNANEAQKQTTQSRIELLQSQLEARNLEDLNRARRQEALLRPSAEPTTSR